MVRARSVDGARDRRGDGGEASSIATSAPAAQDVGAETSAGISPKLHAAQKFEMRRVQRKLLASAPYNPRAISPASRDRLKEKIAEVGLVMPLVWNATTGNLVAGHQRLKILDAIHGGRDYELDVAAIQVMERVERELVVFLNNPSAHGHWDIDALEKMIRAGAKPARMGFDALDIQTLIDAPDLAPMFDLEQQPRDVQELVDTATDFSEEAKAAAREEAGEQAAVTRKAYRESARNRDDPGHIAVVVFRDRKARDAFVRRVGGDVGSQYVDGERVCASLKEE